MTLAFMMALIDTRMTIRVSMLTVSFWKIIALLHFDPKSDGGWISLFKLTKNHKDTFFFVNVATSVDEATAILITVG